MELAVALETQSPSRRIIVSSFMQEFIKVCGHKQMPPVIITCIELGMQKMQPGCKKLGTLIKMSLFHLNLTLLVICCNLASREADGVLLSAGLQFKPVCVSESMCACLLGQYPRHEIMKSVFDVHLGKAEGAC